MQTNTELSVENNIMELDPEILEAIYTNQGDDLKTLSSEKTVMLVFLRHFGCTFCRETLRDISQIYSELKTKSILPVMVHMTEEYIADEYFEKYGLKGTPHISDPDLSLYEYFGLYKGSFLQLYGLKIWLRGLKVGFFEGLGLSTNPQLGDTTRMPGIFLIKDSKVINQFIHTTAADRPDYDQIVSGELSTPPPERRGDGSSFKNR